ncbi:CtsR family transcriptional regulator [Tissierella pigra]|uniref:Transcriptional regulator CtsR n=1 Tax=Tissierella pigra TaxID=2607614 RepID=A0A6N7XWA9_9FIRM|nr:CtsR family transcriptional regulator [Tissierella pigra]MBU5425616.1 CtsR family transcriptional regulator [Tissierella pigra]MSU00834.1 CtsR family transcriptional regulator [Tissierella pigra]
MSGLSNIIERFIKSMIEAAEDSTIEIQRNELAEKFDCAPSQINYVLTTRFTPYKGYYIESRRGGGGYIKIIKVGIDINEDINNIISHTIGESITRNKAYHIIDGLVEEEFISEREGKIIKSVMEDRALSVETAENRNKLRANILKNILLILI